MDFLDGPCCAVTCVEDGTVRLRGVRQQRRRGDIIVRGDVGQKSRGGAGPQEMCEIKIQVIDLASEPPLQDASILARQQSGALRRRFRLVAQGELLFARHPRRRPEGRAVPFQQIQPGLVGELEDATGTRGFCLDRVILPTAGLELHRSEEERQRHAGHVIGGSDNRTFYPRVEARRVDVVRPQPRCRQTNLFRVAAQKSAQQLLIATGARQPVLMGGMPRQRDLLLSRPEQLRRHRQELVVHAFDRLHRRVRRTVVSAPQ